LCLENECNNDFPDYLKKHESVIYKYVGDPNTKNDDFLEQIVKKIDKIVKELLI
jgi:hypothetical protein